MVTTATHSLDTTATALGSAQSALELLCTGDTAPTIDGAMFAPALPARSPWRN